MGYGKIKMKKASMKPVDTKKMTKDVKKFMKTMKYKYGSFKMNMKYEFSKLLLKKMTDDDRIFFITADLGFKLWDEIQKKHPDRCIIMGASEQLAMGAGVGLALDGKIPVVYSITNFLIYRPFEIIRNYINYENLPVKMIGSGRDKDYSHDGISHWSEDDKDVMSLFKNVKTYHPNNIMELNVAMKFMFDYDIKTPYYLNLRR